MPDSPTPETIVVVGESPAPKHIDAPLIDMLRCRGFEVIHLPGNLFPQDEADQVVSQHLAAMVNLRLLFDNEIKRPPRVILCMDFFNLAVPMLAFDIGMMQPRPRLVAWRHLHPGWNIDLVPKGRPFEYYLWKAYDTVLCVSPGMSALENAVVVPYPLTAPVTERRRPRPKRIRFAGRVVFPYPWKSEYETDRFLAFVRTVRAKNANIDFAFLHKVEGRGRAILRAHGVDMLGPEKWKHGLRGAFVWSDLRGHLPDYDLWESLAAGATPLVGTRSVHSATFRRGYQMVGHTEAIRVVMNRLPMSKKEWAAVVEERSFDLANIVEVITRGGEESQPAK